MFAHVRSFAASASAASTSSGVAEAASATTRSGEPGSVEISSSPSRRSLPTHTGTRTGGSRVVLLQRARELRADRRPPQLEDRLVLERLHAVLGSGLASSSEIAAPRACSCRNESFDVFSSSRRTR